MKISDEDKFQARLIIDSVYNEAGFKKTKEVVNSRKEQYVLCRQVCAYLIHKHLGSGQDNFRKGYLTLEAIGELISKIIRRKKTLDHATILHSIRTVRNLLTSKGQIANFAKSLVSGAELQYLASKHPETKYIKEIIKPLVSPV